MERDPAVISQLVECLRAKGFTVSVGSHEELLTGASMNTDVIVFGPTFATQAELFRDFRAVSDALACALGDPHTDPSIVAQVLSAGLDEFCSYPIDANELAERLYALHRRRPRRELILSGGGLKIRLLSQSVTKRGEPVHLSKTELRLLVSLMRERGRPRSRQDLLQEVWGYEYLGRSRLVDMAVRRLREKVEDDPHQPKLVLTVAGGYLFSDGDPSVRRQETGREGPQPVGGR